MKFSIKKSVLQEALQIAISAIPNKSTLQILNDYSLRLSPPCKSSTTIRCVSKATLSKFALPT